MALEFDGVSQYVSIPGSPSLDCSLAMTITFWCYGESDTQNHILNKDDESKNRIWIIRPESSTSLNCHIWTSTGTLIYGEVANSFALNAWHFYTMRAYVSGGNVYVETWMDGVYKGENHAAGTALKTVTAQAINFCKDVIGYYNGILSDVRIYNRSLSANEIAEIYHKRGADRVWQGLVGWWRLDELTSGTPAPLLLDAMDATTGWSAMDGAELLVNNTTYTEGSGALNLSKKSTAINYCVCRKGSVSFNVTNQTIKISVYIKDATVKSKLSQIVVELWSTLGSASYQYYSYVTDLEVGTWNTISEHIDNFTVNGSPSKSSITNIDFGYRTQNTSDTFSSGDIIFDFYRAGDYPLTIPDLSGNGNHGAPRGGVYQASPHRLRRGVLVS